ncbi:MAG: metallophosphoesterase family protein [candidate division WOR-3 bacterium]
MKIAIISDIHANWEALEVVLNYIKATRCSLIICCGDVVGYGANPNECFSSLRQIRNLRIVLGNHDAGVLGKTPIKYFNEMAREAIIWTKKELTKESFEYLSHLVIKDKFYPFHICHASPYSPGSWHYVFSLEEAKYQFRFFAGPICVIGHTHIAFAVEKSDRDYRVIKDDEFLIEENKRYLINVGSVGQPRDGDSRATFGIYDQNKRLFKFVRLKYDIESAARKILNVGLPRPLAERLFLGR